LGSNWPIWGGLGAALIVIVAVAAWFATRPKDPNDFPPRPTPTVTAVPPTVVVVVPTQTPVAGIATFTPVAGANITGPHVLGITAGVGMHGDIAGTAPIAVTFSDPMDQPAAQAAFSLYPSVPGDFKWTDRTLFFTPSSPLKPATDYTVGVSTGAKTQAGAPIAAAMSASFKTAPPPSILRTLPTARASEVPTNAIVTITFNRPMIPLTALDSQPDPSKWITISPAVQGRWVWLGTAAVGFRADGSASHSGFQPATDYTVDVKAGWPDENGVTLSQGTSVTFTTIKPAVTSVEPFNGQDSVPIDAQVVVHFNMPMDHATQANFHMTTSGNQSGLPGVFEWSADSTVMTYTANSLLDFGTEYTPLFSQNVVTANGVSSELAGGDSANTWSFDTTGTTHVSDHSPNSDNGPAQPSNGFSFTFNNPLAPNQQVEQYLTVSPKPEGYVGQLTVSSSSVSTDGVKLLPNTTYTFSLKAGLKDKWGFPVTPSTWRVQIGPLPPSLAIKGGTFQPIYVDGPTRVRVDTANLSSFTFHLRQLSADDMRSLLTRPPYYQPTPAYPGQLKREWQVSVPAGQGNTTSTNTIYPSIALDGNSDRLPSGYYLLYADAPNPYSNDYPLYSATVLIVGRTGVVAKIDGQNLMLWAADLGSGKPVPNYSLRIEQIKNDGSSATVATVQTANTGQDGVARLILDKVDSVQTVAIFADTNNDALFATTGWNYNINPYDFSGVSGAYGVQAYRADAYVDRPIYRPMQTVFYRGVYRLDDDASYTVPQAGGAVEVRAITFTNNGNGPTAIYTGTAALTAAGTVSGQFVIPADAPVGSYTLAFSAPGGSLGSYDYGVATASFAVQEYRKPDFQVDVTASKPVVHGDTVTAVINTSYYFGGPLQNVTATVNIQASPYYFYWADPKTGETYQFGEYNPIPIDFYSPIPYSTPEPVQSFQARTDANGVLHADVTRYITTTNGSKSVLIEGQVQDLSNQTVAANATTVVHQGLYYVGLRAEDYIATAKQPTTITVRTVEWTADKTHPNAQVSLSFVRHEWAVGADGQWKQNDIPVEQASVTTDADGRATYLFTPPSGGQYGVTAESVDARGNKIKTIIEFYASDNAPGAGYVPWHFKNDQQVELVADKDKYSVGDTARILVTSPFTQATGLLTIERGHVRRYRIVSIQGGSPTIEVPLQAGDLPNVYVGLTLLGPERPPDGAPADWGKRVIMRQGYVNLSLDTSGEELQVSVEPQGQGPFKPGSTANVKVTTKDKAGNPVQGDLSLAAVDEAIFAIGGENGPALFDTFWSERGLGVSTSSSFTSGDFSELGRGGGGIAEGAAPMPSAAPQAQDGATRNSAGASQTAPAEPQKVRTNFQDTAFWQADVTTGQDGSATVAVPLPDNLTTWRLTSAAITDNTLAGGASAPLTVTQPLLLTPILPRFLTTGDSPHPQAVIHNNTTLDLDISASLEVSGAISLDKSPVLGAPTPIQAEQTLTIPAGQATVVTWSGTVGDGNAASFRFWVHTNPPNGTYYLEDAVAQSIPVKPFAAPEVVATSGEVSGLRADESVFIPYSVNRLLGQMVVQVSPSLAAATTSSIKYVEEYEYESTDQTVSRFLPLVVLEKVYNDQGFTTPYSKQLPDIMSSSISRLRDLQQPDGGWAWWEHGPSSWFETAYAVQGLAAARDAGYAVPGDMLQRGIQALQSFQAGNNIQGIDETYHLNMRAYTLYVLAYATQSDDSMKSEGVDLVSQTPRLSSHARAWLAMALGKMGMGSQSKTVLDSLAAAARQSSTTAHWEEGTPDYWSMGTDNRATALSIDALVTLSPNDPLVPKAVRWLMTAEKEGHWLSTQETSISLIALAHYIAQSKELGADYTFQVDAFGKTLGQGVAASTNLTQTQTFTLPVSQMPVNNLGDLGLSRSADKGKMYYQVSVRYYVPGEGIKSKSEGLAITRSYYKMTNGVESAGPVKEVNAGDLVKVRLTIVAPETSYYVLVTDPLPAGLARTTPPGSIAGARSTTWRCATTARCCSPPT
jgi:uncharacterized protein YfaS (alpha-2-macroglobulin family)